MSALLDVVLPVLLVIAAGYGLVASRYVSDSNIDGLNRYAIGFAIPCLLFSAISDIDLEASFDWRLLLSFYGGATTTFFAGIFLARRLFGRRPGESVVVGFGALFSNSIIIGLPVLTRAFGAAELEAGIIIVSIHAPFCYLLGIAMMEVSRRDGRGALYMLRTIAATLAQNPLFIGIVLGFGVNLAGLTVPKVLQGGLEMVVASALPVALFCLGGILRRYNLGASLGEAAMVSALSLVVHPSITFALTYYVFALDRPLVLGATTLAAMGPGVNMYIFATLYNRAEDVAASTVLMATLLSILSVSLWLGMLTTL